MRNSQAGNIVAIALLFVFCLLPLLAGLGYAVGYSFGLTGALRTGFTLTHWQQLFADGQVMISFAYSAAISVVALSISVAIAIFVVLKYPRAFGKGSASFFIYLPLAFPAMVAAFFIFQLLSKAGILSRFLYQLHLTHSIAQFPDLVNDTLGIGMIVTHVFLSCPFFVLLFTGIYQTERVDDYILLAKSLGATQRQSVRKLAFPMVLQKASATIALYFVFMFGAYEIPVLLGRSNPEMVSVLAVRKLQKFNLLDIPQGYAIAVLYTLFVMVFIVFIIRKRATSNDV